MDTFFYKIEQSGIFLKDTVTIDCCTQRRIHVTSNKLDRISQSPYNRKTDTPNMPVISPCFIVKGTRRITLEVNQLPFPKKISSCNLTCLAKVCFKKFFVFLFSFEPVNNI